MARILASGANVVSSSVVPLLFPDHVDPQMRAPLEDACTTGGTSMFTSGIDPGFANDLLPLVLTGTCEYVDTVRVMEIVNYNTYAQPEVLFGTMGFGQALDATPLLLVPGVLSFAWGGVVTGHRRRPGRRDRPRCVEVHERLPAPGATSTWASVWWRRARPPRCASSCRASSTARPASCWSTSPAWTTTLAPDWPQPAGHSGYRVIVTGNPNYTLDLQMMGDDGDHNTAGLVGTAGRIVNAIPAVCAARPGLLSVLDLPLIGGTGTMR